MGEVPKPPLADADTQAVTAVALQALAVLSGEKRWHQEAARLRTTIGEAFDAETLAVAGDGKKSTGRRLSARLALAVRLMVRMGWIASGGTGDKAEEIRRGVLEAIETIGRAPELFAACPEGPRPVPIANRLQAWTVGARWALENQWDGRATALFG